ESIGIKILRKLGWKPGQGIGPRIKKTTSVKFYGCSPFPETAELEEDDPYAQSFTFAPDDTEAERYQPKDNVFGLGYSGLSKESVLSARIDTFTPTTTKSWLKKDKKKLAISGQAFGVGAFEDDDEDIYSKDDMSQYDFSDLELRGASQATNASGSKQLIIAHNVVEGFRLASQPPAIKKYYPPPQLPPNFRPVRISVTPKIHSHQETQIKPRHNLSADERSFLLGEKKFQSFQLTSEKKSLEGKTSGDEIAVARDDLLFLHPEDGEFFKRREIGLKPPSSLELDQ
ncbi:G patch domain-containing protein 1, partial [Araneus ventricosus]